MGEPGDREKFEALAKTPFTAEWDPEHDPNVARYNVELARAMGIQRQDMIITLLSEQNDLLKKLTVAIVKDAQRKAA